VLYPLSYGRVRRERHEQAAYRLRWAASPRLTGRIPGTGGAPDAQEQLMTTPDQNDEKEQGDALKNHGDPLLTSSEGNPTEGSRHGLTPDEERPQS
jgi:hypothetical protein